MNPDQTPRTPDQEPLVTALENAADNITGRVTWDQVLTQARAGQVRRRRYIAGASLVATVAAVVAVVVVAGAFTQDGGRGANAGQTGLLTLSQPSPSLPSPTSTMDSSDGHSATSASGNSDRNAGYVISVQAGFADPDSVATDMITGYSSGVHIAENTVTAGWSKADDTIVVTLFGSGSCPRLIQTVTGDSAGTDQQFISLGNVDTRKQPASSLPAGWGLNSPDVTYPRACTLDLSPLTTLVHPPTGFSRAHKLRLSVDGVGVITLPAVR